MNRPICECTLAGEGSAPWQVPAVRRGLSNAIPPVVASSPGSHPEGVPASFASDQWGCGTSESVTGGVAALSPRLMAASPPASNSRLAILGIVVASSLTVFHCVTTRAGAQKKDSNSSPSSDTPAISAKGESSSTKRDDQESSEPTPAREVTPQEKAALAEGQALFRGLCSGCHGGMGRGGKGPDLTDSRWLHGDKDE